MAAEYDYIVVGSGSAGSVLAARLSEDADVSVLVLEAGGADRRLFLDMPIALRIIGADRNLNWNYQSEPEPYANNRSVRVPRGRVVGGSSTINGMTYMRGHPTDYDQWRQMGCTGWSFADVLPYFRKLESNWRGESAWHGADGPVAVSPCEHPALPFADLAAAAKAAGVPETDDFNGPNPEGIGRADLSVDHGRRASTSRAYLHPALSRPNLRLESNALATRLLIEGGRAVGLEYRQHGQLQRVHARREVLLAGGAYNSPQLLMLSGIGPAEQLRQHGIQVIHDLPGVGENLSEHSNTRTQFLANGRTTLLSQFRFDRAARWVLQWKLFGTGLYATNGSAAHIFLRSRPELDSPDLQITCAGVRLDARLWFPGIRPEQAHRWEPGVVVLRPRSRGHMRLRSADPADAPRITFNLFKEQADMDTAIAGVRAVRDIFGPQRGLTTKELAPGPDAQSDADLAKWIRSAVLLTQHPVGTCSMGQGVEAVVDPELRVRGIEGLRVVDASVMPTVPGGNINAPVIMLAERAADLIRGRVPLTPEVP